MMFKFFSIFILSLIAQGCVSYTTKLDYPIERQVITEDYFSSIETMNTEYLSATIGDELFVMNRFISNEEIIPFIPPTGNWFPVGSTWSGTYKYNDGTSGDLIVYTTPDYYKGNIGVILDKNEHLATNRPLVQVEGSKTGRRWGLNGEGAFFRIPQKNIDSWALRYGGKNNSQYVFQIVNKHESKTTDVLQTIYITEEKFRAGFVIRNVLIKGANSNEYGGIEYQLKDMLKK